MYIILKYSMAIIYFKGASKPLDITKKKIYFLKKLLIV